MNQKKIAFIRMGNYQQTVEVERINSDATGRIMITAKSGKVYETHISNIVIETTPEQSAI